MSNQYSTKRRNRCILPVLLANGEEELPCSLGQFMSSRLAVKDPPGKSRRSLTRSTEIGNLSTRLDSTRVDNKREFTYEFSVGSTRWNVELGVFLERFQRRGSEDNRRATNVDGQ
ncbi:unnamed protein product, partial [Heterotrigona itama]